SRSVVKKTMSKKIKNEVRSYTIKILHQTVMTGGEPKIGDKISMGAMRQKSEDYEKFEMNVFLPMWEKQLLNGNDINRLGRIWIVSVGVKEKPSACGRDNLILY
ncbi:hypothetical protein N9313_06505, partial [Flavobacteriaceae bacterium]|nr:hypothetical protein [Flavobacteriaceae bacterium]